MNRTEKMQSRANDMNRLMKWPLLCGLLALALARTTFAADALYQNDGIVNYPAIQSSPPVIDATNFVNNGSFTINFTTVDVATLVQPFYETSDTQNYTNSDNGVMMVDTGFRFDNQASSAGTRTMSANFFNSGYISCASANNPTDPFAGLLGSALGYAQCFITASNIVNPGTVDAGVDGLIQFTGHNVDLSHGTLNLEGAGANAFGFGGFGLNTNFWDPSLFLGPNFAESSPPFVFLLPNSTVYINIKPGITNNIVQAVFIEDFSPTNSDYSISQNVYFYTAFSPLTPFIPPFGQHDFATVEWIGSFRDVASDHFFKSYLYLDDDYSRGGSTNVLLNVVSGFPDNFNFRASSTPWLAPVAPAPAGFQNVFSVGSTSNLYAYANVGLVPSTVSTNSIVNLSITNLPGRIQIAATNELNLAYTEISGPNYLSVQATNQFDGSAGALIQSPYSDLNLGVTNGFLIVSNTLAPQVPTWNGNVEAWTTSWTGVDANGVTNDYEVLIVGSVLNPTTRAQVQDLILHGTNSMISDSLNVMRTLNADAQNLTLTTNGFGVGATSLEGEINFISPQIIWQNSLPNLRNLTNNGAIRTANLVNFGNPLVVNAAASISGVAATGTLSRANASVVNVTGSDHVTIGTNRYAFVSVLTNTVANQIKIASAFDGSMSNFIAAINGAAGAGTTYSTATRPNPSVTAGLLAAHAFTVTAVIAGTAGNSIPTLLASANLTWNGNSTLTGGVDPVAGSTNVVSFPYDNFINSGLVSDQGSMIWAGNFQSSGVISNGINSFSLQSLTTTLTNGAIVAGGDIAITAGSLVTSNLNLQAGRSLTLQVTNLLTDGVPNGTEGLTNGNVWLVQSTNSSGGNGLILPIKPAAGDLLGTTISNYAAGPNKLVANLWAGQDRGVSANGYTNNVAVGRLVLDAIGATSQFKFSGAGAGNAIYVDELVFLDQATNGVNSSYDFSENLSIGPNVMIYFAQALADGVSIAEKIDAASKAGRNNGGRLRWVPQYAGYFSSTNLVYPDGTTNTFNAALAGSTTIDSDGDGIPNASDPTPFLVGSELQLNLTLTNALPGRLTLTWNASPGSTNYVFYKTNLLSANWLVLTNFISPGGGGQSVPDMVTNQARFYQVRVDPAN